jgi:surface polysaccharide O-acyltransferase-like enzyme
MPPPLTETTSPVVTGLSSPSQSNGARFGASGERLFWADVLRAYAIAAVVIIHCCASFTFNFSSLRPADWWVCNILDSFSRAGVGLFVLLSGMFLLDRHESIAVFFQKRFTKVVIPFLFWQTFYAVWLALRTSHHVELSDVWPAILSKPTSFHLWYPFMLLGLYLATPILRIYVKNANKGNLQFFLVSWFIFACCAPVFERLFHWTVNIQPVIAIGYSGYFVLGYYLRKHVQNMPSPALIITGVIGAGAITAAVTNHLSAARGALDESAYDYLSPNVVILCICSFFALKRLASADWGNFNSAFVQRMVSMTSQASYGIYLIHILILVTLAELVPAAMHGHAAINMPLLAIATLIASLAIVRVLQSIPILRALVP